MGAQERRSRRCDELYDEIWVYGLPQICDPLAGHRAAGDASRDKMVYTGYLRRDVPPTARRRDPTGAAGEPVHPGHDRRRRRRRGR